MSLTEIEVRINKLEFADDGDVTVTAQEWTTIFSGAPAAAIKNLKTLVIHNVGASAVYFGHNDSVTTSTGCPIDPGESREFPTQDWAVSPWFIAAGTIDVRVEMWS